MAGTGLSHEQRQTLWEQFVDVYAEEQKSYDSSVRTLAAAGVAVTVSLATALQELPTSGKWSVGLFLGSLAFNLCSYVTSQLDMRKRLNCLREDKQKGLEGNFWTTTTTVLNVLAGVALISGGVLLAIFVSRAA